MTMAAMEPGKKPRVENYKGRVAVWAGQPDEPIGLVIDAMAAGETAIEMLRTVAEIRGENLPMLHVESVSAEPAVLDDGEEAAKLTFTIMGVPFAAWLNLTQFAELAAGLSYYSRKMDQPE